MTEQYIGQKVLLTVRDWFVGPDGRQYRSVHGTLRKIHKVEDLIGFAPSRQHANWVLEVGEMTVMGCQMLTIIKTDIVNTKDITESQLHEGKYNLPTKPNDIFHTT